MAPLPVHAVKGLSLAPADINGSFAGVGGVNSSWVSSALWKLCDEKSSQGLSEPLMLSHLLLGVSVSFLSVYASWISFMTSGLASLSPSSLAESKEAAATYQDWNLIPDQEALTWMWLEAVLPICPWLKTDFLSLTKILGEYKAALI